MGRYFVQLIHTCYRSATTLTHGLFHSSGAGVQARALAAGGPGGRRPSRGTRTPRAGPVPAGIPPRRARSARRDPGRQRRHPRAGARAHVRAAAEPAVHDCRPDAEGHRRCCRCRCSTACSRSRSRWPRPATPRCTGIAMLTVAGVLIVGVGAGGRRHGVAGPWASRGRRRAPKPSPRLRPGPERPQPSAFRAGQAGGGRGHRHARHRRPPSVPQRSRRRTRRWIRRRCCSASPAR